MKRLIFPCAATHILTERGSYILSNYNVEHDVKFKIALKHEILGLENEISLSLIIHKIWVRAANIKQSGMFSFLKSAFGVTWLSLASQRHEQ